MKRRYTFLFFAALTPLIGLSWLATNFGFSMWAIRGLGLLGSILAAVFAGAAMIRNVNVRWPAGVVVVVSLPNAPDVLRSLIDLDDFVRILGVPFLLLAFGWLATAGGALAIALLPKPPPPRDPQVALARVVD